MRGQKGITLVALIITIIVLLILAVVAIAAITDTDLMGQAKNAVNTHNDAANNELQQLQNYSTYIQTNYPS